MREQLYVILDRCPALEEYRSICSSVGWEGFINFDAAAGSLANEQYGFRQQPGLTGMFCVTPVERAKRGGGTD
ncbi:hypothetical protein ACFQI7_15720 [Paenibacillus allorhizosphaerae]|uniref:Uncharacterized protein n=1 Tax=Paenibacillus allorhizosphaerae TaxID=2849866 RepID=A0ABM8VE15_9BACL|nr:hypothetical protein [Paenibacillus allorhizosphaerae]CAG7629067.1 hypothetical protein PAECIP111802_01520 [Paenibacillus allorhizosphaerae]